MVGAYAENPSLLAGLIIDQTGRPLTPTHANKRGKRYRYYGCGYARLSPVNRITVARPRNPDRRMTVQTGFELEHALC